MTTRARGRQTLCGDDCFGPSLGARDADHAFHFAHHRFTQDPGNDPELATPKPSTMGGLIWHVTGIPMWIALLRGLLARASGRLAEPFYATDRVRQSVVTESRLALAIYLALLIGSVATGSTWGRSSDPDPSDLDPPGLDLLGLDKAHVNVETMRMRVLLHHGEVQRP